MADARARPAAADLHTLFAGGTAVGLTDAQLLDRYLARRTEAAEADRAAEAAFAALVARHGPMVLGVCRRRLVDPSDVDDAFQATFLVLARRAEVVRVEGSLGRWLYGVACRVSGKARARRARDRAASITTDPPAPVPDPDRAELLAALDEELSRLPTRYRLPVVLCYFEGLTYAETAERLAWPLGTVNGRLVKARALLRARLTRRGMVAPAGVLGLLLTEEARAAVPEALAMAATRLAATAGAGGIVPTLAALTEGELMAITWWRVVAISAAAILGIAAGGVGIFASGVAVAPGPASGAKNVAEERPQAPAAGERVGVVLDQADRPVGGAMVVGGQYSGGEPNHRITTTGEDGRFELTPPDGAKALQYMLAYKEGFAPAGWFPFGKKEADDPVLRLGLPEPFVGVVTDVEGRPIAGASVRLTTVIHPGPDGAMIYLNGIEPILRGTPLDRLFHTTTDEQGRFHFPAVPRGARGDLLVKASGMGDYRSTNHRQGRGDGYVTGTPEAPAGVAMAPAARIEGRIVTRLPGVNVGGIVVQFQGSLNTHGMWGETRTDAGGRFAFEGMGAGTVNVFTASSPQPGDWTCRAIADLKMKPGETSKAEIELIRGVLVEGRVILAVRDEKGVVNPTDQPAVGVTIGMYGPARPDSGAAILSAKTDGEGRYRFRLPPGLTRLYVAEDGRGGGINPRIPDDVATYTASDIWAVERPR